MAEDRSIHKSWIILFCWSTFRLVTWFSLSRWWSGKLKLNQLKFHNLFSKITINFNCSNLKENVIIILI